jgi:hypothetical protein
MKDPNSSDVPETAEPSAAMTPPTPPEEPVTLPPNWEEPKEWWVDWWSKSDHEDVMTYLIFAEDGSVVFKVVYDGTAFDDFADSTQYEQATRYTVEARLREKLFSSFLQTLPADEALLRFAFAKAVKKALERSMPKNLLESKGIPYSVS